MLLAVLTCQSATETAQRHYETWRKYCENIVFITTVDSHCWVPEGRESWAIGRDFYPDRDKPDDNLCRRTMGVLERFLKSANMKLCLIEYDVVLFDKPRLKNDFSGTMFEQFIHPPWLFTRHTAHKFLQCGETLLRHGSISGGWPDRHLRLIFDLVQPVADESVNYSKNTLDQPHFITEAREFIAAGGWAVHGVKSKEQLEALCA
jgi:hypothetical protein